MAPSVVDFTDAGFETEVLKASGTVLVDFWAPWCNPCKTLHPVFEEIARNQATENVHFVRVNIDESPGLASALGIMSIPTLMLCDLGGNEVDRITGMPNRQRLDAFVAQAGSLTT